ncbi:MAG: copper amine oxidase N-terminal domain-containing protein [archaeon]|nr:copper amine oxidase N-terminal domain-containing protein [archaeon]
MKKITKRIMALMLSLVMVFGCVPCFINEVSAAFSRQLNNINFIKDLPSTLEDAWANENGYKLCYTDKLCLYDSTDTSILEIDGTKTFIGSDTEWEYLDNRDFKINATITTDKLTSIDISGGDYGGTYKVVLKPISEVNIISSGVLATNIQTLKYEAEEEEDAPYILSDVPTSSWYKEEELTNAYDLTATGDAYKKLVLSPKSGYKFDEYATISLNGTGTIWGDGTLNDDGTLTVVIKATVEDIFTKSATITLPITAGTTIDQIRNRATLTDTTNTANFNIVTGKRFIKIYGLKDDGAVNMSDLKDDDTYALEVDKKYAAMIQLEDEEENAYETVNVNNKVLNFDKTASDGFITLQIDQVTILYYFTAEPAPVSRGSKKYKATDTKDTTEKITGTGKKGSTRTIVPEEGRKVASVKVVDKNGNEVPVTLNEDGTYSFKQPASNVDVQVNYKNREITLNIGATEASVDGERENLDVCPVIRNDRTMLPIRFVAENLGAKVEWSEKNSNYVVIARGDTKIEITLGSDIMKVNGKDVKLDSVAFAENDRTYLPVRAISEALNAIVEWNESEPSIVRIYERQ